MFSIALSIFGLGALYSLLKDQEGLGLYLVGGGIIYLIPALIFLIIFLVSTYFFTKEEKIRVYD